MAVKLGAQGRKVVEALDDGRAFRRCGEGWQAGVLTAPASLIGELARHDLVREERGALMLTAAGRSWRSRSARPDASNRLPAERPLPQDGEAGPGKAAARSVTVNLAESPLGWLKSRGLLSARQYEAGERLRGDWTMAGLGPHVTMRWDASPMARNARGPGGGIDPTLAQIDAKRRFEAALDAAGPGLKDVLWRVACAGEGLETAEAALGWPTRAGKLVLLMALDRVADHFRLA
jgi:hypothetical protein